MQLVQPSFGTRFVAPEAKATYRPSSLSAGDTRKLLSSASPPALVRLTRSVVPACRSRRNTSGLEFVSPRTRLVASETNATPREGAGLIAELIETQGQMLACQDQMVALWTEYQALRLSLDRDLGALPFGDWPSFYEQLTAGRGADAP